MTALFFLFSSLFTLLLSAPLVVVVQGFAPVAPVRSAVSTTATDRARPLFAYSSGPEHDDEEVTPYAFAEEYDEDEGERLTAAAATSAVDPKAAADVAKAKAREAAAKAEEALSGIADKVQGFVDDETVKDLAGKAAEFAKDVGGFLFAETVGRKLKELKKEKEEGRKKEKKGMATTAAAAAKKPDDFELY